MPYGAPSWHASRVADLRVNRPGRSLWVPAWLLLQGHGLRCGAWVWYQPPLVHFSFMLPTRAQNDHCTLRHPAVRVGTCFASHPSFSSVHFSCMRLCSVLLSYCHREAGGRRGKDRAL